MSLNKIYCPKTVPPLRLPLATALVFECSIISARAIEFIVGFDRKDPSRKSGYLVCVIHRVACKIVSGRVAPFGNNNARRPVVTIACVERGMVDHGVLHGANRWCPARISRRWDFIPR
jgi:hypothetical protein